MQIYCITIAQILGFNIEQLKLFDIQTILEQCNYILKREILINAENNNILVHV